MAKHNQNRMAYFCSNLTLSTCGCCNQAGGCAFPGTKACYTEKEGPYNVEASNSWVYFLAASIFILLLLLAMLLWGCVTRLKARLALQEGAALEMGIL